MRCSLIKYQPATCIEIYYLHYFAGLELLGDEEEMVSGKKEEEVELECAVQSDTDTTFSWTGTEGMEIMFRVTTYRQGS